MNDEQYPDDASDGVQDMRRRTEEAVGKIRGWLPGLFSSLSGTPDGAPETSDSASENVQDS